MINKEFEPEYDSALKLWDEVFRKLNKYEESITVELNRTHSITLDERYEKLLGRENLLHKKLDEARGKFFGLEKTEDVV